MMIAIIASGEESMLAPLTVGEWRGAGNISAACEIVLGKNHRQRKNHVRRVIDAIIILALCMAR